MLKVAPLQKPPPSDPAFDQRALYFEGIEHIRRLAGKVWTDHNLHDPGITVLEQATYALTELSYRASYPVEDLLASAVDNQASMAAAFFSAREVETCRALTLLDYRKLVIDVKGVKNAWLQPVREMLFADPVAGKLVRSPPVEAGLRKVEVQGLYGVLLDFMDDLSVEAQPAVIAAVRSKLQANRNLCQDFTSITAVAEQRFSVCGELEVLPEADVAAVHADILFRISQYLDPPVANYTLAEMLARRRPDGTPFVADDVFEGPALDFGFIDDDELRQAELRGDVRLSDVISIVMGVAGVRAVRDLIINPTGTTTPLVDKWRLLVTPGARPTLDVEGSHLLSYKRNLPIRPEPAAVLARCQALFAQARGKVEPDAADRGPVDLPIPVGRFRNPANYASFQRHFPSIYGLSEQGLLPGADDARKQLALQLKGYLLFFDQLLADSFAQLASVSKLFSSDETLASTWAHAKVDSFPDARDVYAAADPKLELAKTDDPAADGERRNRFLDHLIARFGEQFGDYAAATAPLGATSQDFIKLKCAFLEAFPVVSAERGLGYDTTKPADTDLAPERNVSGLQKRVAKLLGFSGTALGPDGPERLLVIESLLLRLPDFQSPLLPICAEPDCADCADDDPYSCRIHVVLPALVGRFLNMDFRRFTEEVIRQETPAHVMPQVCWVDTETMIGLEAAWKAWTESEAEPLAERQDRLTRLRDALWAARSVYPVEKLMPCTAGDEQPKFILTQSRLGTIPKP